MPHLAVAGLLLFLGLMCGFVWLVGDGAERRVYGRISVASLGLAGLILKSVPLW